MRDAVSIDLVRHLDAQDRRRTAVDRRAAELLAADFNPYTPEHVAEAMGELSGEVINRIAQSFEQVAVSAGGATLYYAIHNYWHRRAEAQAAAEIAGASCARCYDEGCPSCNGDQP